MYAEKYEKYRNKIDFIKSYRTAKNAATGSKYDSNANVEHKNICTCAGELVKGDKIEIFNYGDCRRDFTYIDNKKNLTLNNSTISVGSNGRDRAHCSLLLELNSTF